MKLDDLNKFKEWFKSYLAEVCASLHDEDLEAIFLKEQHTHRVVKDMRLLAESLDELSAEDRLLAETIALFHDVGRFPQWLEHRTFMDSKSRDHAAIGLEVLKERQVLAELPDRQRAIIETAIRYHNAKDIPPDLEPRALLFTKLIRDADKLDIWRVIIEHRPGQSNVLDRLIVGEMSPSTSFSSEILETLMKGDKSDMRLAKTPADLKLLRIGWMFDVSFEKTASEILKRNYVEKLISQLPCLPQITEFGRFVEDWLKRFSSNGSRTSS